MKTKRVGLYVRVSTTGQSTESQEEELREFVENRGWTWKLYRDQGQSGAKENRPALSQLLKDCRQRRVDIVVVWSLDRLARSVSALLGLLDELHQLSIDFIATKQQIDTSTAAGRLSYHVLACIAEFEREMLRERVRAGLANARKKGRRLGRPPLQRLTAEEKEEIRRLHAAGQKSVRQLAQDYRATQYIVAKALAEGKEVEARICKN